MTVESDKSFGAVLVTALLAGVAGVAGSYALAGYTRAFVAAPIASFLTQNMPDAVLRFAIVTLTDIGRQFGMPHLGQQLNLLLALTLGTALFASLALAALATGRRLQNPFVSGGLVWLAAAVLTRAPVTALGAGVASGIVVAVAVFAVTAGESTDVSVSSGRQEVLGGLVSALGVGILGYVLGSRSGTGTQRAGEAGLSDASTAGDAPAVQEYLAAAKQRALDIEGLEGLVSGDDFYVVDIRNIDPNIAPNDWTLSVTGAVEERLEFTYEDIITMERELRFSTLRCVSDPLNGKLLDNDLWTGVPIMRLIEQANPQGEFVVLRSDDGYYEEFPTDTLREGFLAYGKNGGRLPRQHGFPVRALIPGHWGEVSVK
jgi:DMSO/TMAO reductase YedYZ molybdopterin-dependent catalytic subunit